MKKRDKKFDDRLIMEKFKEYESSGSIKVRNEIVEMNMPLVKYIVTTKLSNLGVELNELISLGHFGLIKAVETYDSDYGSSFGTYATTCILNYIKKGLHTVIDIENKRIVYPVLNAISRIEKEYNISLEEHLNKLDEILEKCDFINDDIKKRIYNYFAYKIDNLNDDRECVYEMEDSVIEHVLIEELDKALDELPEEQREILKFRYGYYGKCYGLDEIGKIKGYTHTTVSNRERDAIYKLKRRILNRK